MLASLSTQADTNFRKGTYDFFTDGSSLYLKAKKRFVPIGTDIIVPLFVQTSPHLKLTPEGSNYRVSLIDPFPASGLTRVYDLDALTGDFDGDGQQDLVLAPNIGDSKSTGGKLLVIEGVTGDFASTTVTAHDRIEGISVNNATFTVADTDGDGRDELLVTGENGLQQVANFDSHRFASDRSLKTATLTGNTPTEFDVTYGGAASYKIPLAVPTGAAGLRPDIYLNYNSQNGNGVMGLGWQLATGTARITECYRRSTNTIIHCLNGEELRNVGESYYRTKIDSGILVHKVDDDTYQLHYENGTVKTLKRELKSPSVYLEKTHTQRGGAAYTLAWQINTTHREPLLDSIDYQGNQIKFHYESRADVRYGYWMGSQRNRTRRLSKVTASSDGKPYRGYEVFYEYDAVSGLSKVQKIQECSANAGECLKPLVFGWSESTGKGFGGSSYFSKRGGALLDLDNNGRHENVLHPSSYSYGDFDGDGLPDRQEVRQEQSNSDGDYQVYNFILTTGKYLSFESRHGYGFKKSSRDFDGDGYADILGRGSIFWGSRRYGISERDKTNLPRESLGCIGTFYGDIDGNGMTDILYAEVTSREAGEDGCLGYTGVRLYLNNNRSFQRKSVSLDYQNLKSFKDINGDGLDDAIYRRDKDHYYYRLNKGNGSFAEKRDFPKYAKIDNLMDLNADGLPDFVVGVQDAKENEGWIFYNTGHGVSSGIKQKNIIGRYGDINGDGVRDVVYHDRRHYVRYGQAKRPYINTFTDSNGNEHKVNYSKLTDDNANTGVYTRDKYNKGVNFGNTKPYQQPLTVVKSITTPDNTVHYKYAGARMHNGEHGYLGFGSITSSVAKKDAKGNDVALVTTSYLNQQYPLVGKLKRVNKKVYKNLSAADAINKVIYKYNADIEANALIAHIDDTAIGQGGDSSITTKTASLDTGSDFTGQMNSSFEWKSFSLNGGVSKPYLAKKVVDHLQLSNSSLIKSETSTSLWQVHGGKYARLKSRTMTTADASRNTQQQSMTEYSYKETGTYGLPASFLVQKSSKAVEIPSATGGLSSTGGTGSFFTNPSPSKHIVIKDYDYHANGLLKTEWLNKDHTQGLRTDYAYDSHGNVTTTTVAPVTPTGDSDAARSTSRSYTAQGKYLASETNAKGQTTRYSDYSVHGLPKTLTDTKGLVTRQTFDGLGRPASTTDYLGNTSYIKRGFCHTGSSAHGCTGNPAGQGAYTWEKTEPAGSAHSYTWRDKKGLVVKTATQSLEGVNWHVQTMAYDGYGRMTAESTPRLAALNATIAIDAQSGTQYTYDELSRVVGKNLPGNRVVKTDLGKELAVRVTDPAGRIWETQTNALGQTVAKGKVNALTLDPETRVSFKYDAQGNVLEQHYPVLNADGTLSGNNTHHIKNSYDRYGRQLSVKDPNLGEYQYVYNAYGELIRQTDGKGQITAFTYDSLGRMLTQQDNDTFSLWEYDRTASETGLLARVTQYDLTNVSSSNRQGLTADNITSRGGQLMYRQEIQYDPVVRQPGQVKTRQRNRAGQLEDSTAATTYDKLGRAKQATLPTLYKQQGSLKAPQLQYDYNPRGYLTHIRDARNPQTIYQHNTRTDAFGNLTHQVLGGSVTVKRKYRQHTGWAENIVASNHRGTLSDQYYQHNTLGLVTQKDDAAYYANSAQQSWTDTYRYTDTLQQQLTRWGVEFSQTGGSASELAINWTHDYVYDPLGNTRKRTVTVAGNQNTPQATTATQTYHYNEAASPHRLTSLTQGGNSHAYQYDNNGSITADGKKTFEYFSWNKVRLITRGSNTTRFEYNPDRSRTLRVDTQDGKTTETLYVGGSYERVSAANSTEHRYTLGGTTLITQTENANTETTRHLVTDYQGSTIAITSANGDIEQRFRYTPYGEQVDVSVGLTRDKGVHSLTTMGYTGHEHIEGMDVVHMNGRIYDPVIGRMLQVDPVVQAPNFVLSYNRYAYVWNNPVNMIDPTGYFGNSYEGGGKFGYTKDDGNSYSYGECTSCGGNEDPRDPFLDKPDKKLHEPAVSPIPQVPGTEPPVTPGGDIPDPEKNGKTPQQKTKEKEKKKTHGRMGPVKKKTPKLSPEQTRKNLHKITSLGSIIFAALAFTPCSAACVAISYSLAGIKALDHVANREIFSAATSVIPAGAGFATAKIASQVMSTKKAASLGFSTDILTGLVAEKDNFYRDKVNEEIYE